MCYINYKNLILNIYICICIFIMSFNILNIKNNFYKYDND